MDAKEYLGQVKSREARIRNLRRDREGIVNMLYSLGGAREGERVQSSRNNDKFGTLYGRIDEMEKEIDSQITDLMRFQLKVSMEINELKTDKYMTVLNCRYIHFMSWEKIAESADRRLAAAWRQAGVKAAWPDRKLSGERRPSHSS